MARAEWVVTEGSQRIAQGTHAEILALINERDPFVIALSDGMTIHGLTVAEVQEEPIQRTEEERMLRAFSDSLHGQIHTAADAAYRGEYNKCRELLRLVHERLNNFAPRHLNTP
jgi:hypothetical protein